MHEWLRTNPPRVNPPVLLWTGLTSKSIPASVTVAIIHAQASPSNPGKSTPMATHAYSKQAGKKYRYRRFAHPVVQPDGSADMGFNDGPDHSKPQDAQKGAANDCIGGVEHP